MSSGGKGGAPSGNSTQVVQQDIPAYLKPYYTRMLQKGEAVTNEPYQTYGGQRLAGFGADTQLAQQGARNLFGYGTPGTQNAMGLAGYAAQIGLNANEYVPGQYGGSYDSHQYTSDMMGSPEYNRLLGTYMDPYIGSVVSTEQQSAILDYNRQKSDRNTGAIKAGAFGGSRQAVGDYLNEEGLMNRLQGITATGYENAFQQAQQAALGSQQFNIGTDIQNQQLSDASRQFAAQHGLDIFGANETARQQALQLALQGGQLGLYGAQTMGDLEKQQQALRAEQIKMQAGVGADYDQLKQSGLDLSYEDFVNQRDYPRNNLAFMAGLLRGVPANVNQTVSYQQAYNPLSSLVGGGLGGYALYNLFNGGGGGTAGGQVV